MHFEQIADDGTTYLRVTKHIDKSGNELNIEFHSASYAVITDSSLNEYRIYAEEVIDGYHLISKIETVPYGSSEIKTWTYAYSPEGFLVRERFEELFASTGYGDYILILIIMEII